MHRSIYLLGFTMFLTLPHFASSQTLPASSLSLSGARMVMSAAVKYAKENEAPGGAIAIVDNGGHLVMLERLDGTFAAASNVSIGKARTAALFQFPTRRLETVINEGRTTMVALTGVTPFTPLRGGVPLTLNGEVVGAIGVSGAASAQQDDEIAQAATDEFAKSVSTATRVEYLPNAAVSDAFVAGAPLVETDSYKVHASRRDAAGEAEIHLDDTDIFYIRDGSATFVTGGEIVGARRIGPGEIRGTSIEGGEEQRLEGGDVVVIPKGTPHWFKSVSSPMTYYVVKNTG